MLMLLMRDETPKRRRGNEKKLEEVISNEKGPWRIEPPRYATSVEMDPMRDEFW